MECRYFDALSRQLGLNQSRRATVRTLMLGVSALVPGVAVLLPGETAAATRCTPIGVKCGGETNPRCKSCCTRYATRSRKGGQQRCTCRPDLKKCRRSDQCCSGICERIDCSCGGDGKKRCIPGLLGVSPA